MEQINIKTSLKGPEGINELECIGTKENNVFTYDANNITTKITIDEDKITINREAHDYDLEISLKENKQTSGSLVLYKSKVLVMPVVTTKLLITNNSLEASYNIDGIGEFEYTFKYEQKSM